MVDIDRIISERIEEVSPFFIIKKSTFTKKGKKGIKKTLIQLGNDFKDKLVHSIETRSFKHKPLSTKYKDYKKRNMLDPRTLIATGEYIDSIKVRTDRDGNVVVAPSRTIRKGTKISNADIGRFLEYGTRTCPARPHWKPTIKAFRNTIMKKVKDYVNTV